MYIFKVFPEKNVFESCPKYLGALTWNHPRGKGVRVEQGSEGSNTSLGGAEVEQLSWWPYTSPGGIRGGIEILHFIRGRRGGTIISEKVRMDQRGLTLH